MSVGWSVRPSVCPSLCNILKLHAVFASLLLSDRPLLDCRVPGLVFLGTCFLFVRLGVLLSKSILVSNFCYDVLNSFRLLAYMGMVYFSGNLTLELQLKQDEKHLPRCLSQTNQITSKMQCSFKVNHCNCTASLS